MIDQIGSVTLHQVLIPSNNAVFNRNAENEKPINSDEKVEDSITKNVIENGKLIVEEYDRHGKLLRKTPPGYLLPGEKC